MEDFSPEIIYKYFAPNGPMEQSVPGFKYRSEQAKLASSVADAFNKQEFLLAEVGTGVGKTFSYLLPAVLWAINSGEKVIISTRTKALQQQIVERDLGDVGRVIKNDFKYAEAKGRENFLCWNKYMNILAGKKSLEKSELQFLEAILHWAENTRSGDRKEIKLNSSLMVHWGLLAADRKSCQREQCIYHEKCFRLKMMKKLEKANIIIANHALLLSDMLVENRLLPEYRYLVVDEAHAFDREAFDKLSLRFSYQETMETLQFLQRPHLYNLKKQYPDLSAEIDEATVHLERAIQLTNSFFASWNLTSGANNQRGFAQVVKNEDQADSWFADTASIHRDWQDNINLLANSLYKIEEKIDGLDNRNDFSILLQSLREYADQAWEIMEECTYRDDMIIWVEYANRRISAVAASPVCIGGELETRLYPKLQSMIMVSATLAVENRFDYFVDKYGLSNLAGEERVNTLLENSPFNYEKQAGILLLSDLPIPADIKYNEELAAVLTTIIDTTGGKTLVLFTSKRHLKEMSDYIRPHCEYNNIKLLVQNEDGGFAALMDQFTSVDNGVLMGLETFWEGIDLKGDLLKCLVIVKLPFRSPDEPFCSAWDKYYRSQNKSSFKYFLLPDAAVRFKQGIGRLIRSEKDRGAVVVLDNRLERSTYGQVFLNSIPIKNVVRLGRNDLAENIRKWI